MQEHMQAVEAAKAYRLINHGPVVLVSARHAGLTDVMAASWCCALDFDPPKLTLVLDKSCMTRELAERSGELVVQVPTAAQLALVMAVGSRSLREQPDKLVRAGVQLFGMPDLELPFVQDCAGWMACRIRSEPHNQQQYDLFICEVTAAWADDRVFRDGRWQFDSVGSHWRSLHYVAGGQFFATGATLLAD